MARKAIRWAAVGLLLALGCGDDRDRDASPRLLLEMLGPELVVSVQDGVVDESRRTVLLVCIAADGREVLHRRFGWPFTDTDGGTLPPHVHTPLTPAARRTIGRCRIEGAGQPIEGVPSIAR